MKIINESLNEYYKTPNFKINNFGFNIPELTYVDKVFDEILDILMDENDISEKDFKKFDSMKLKLKNYFDNHQEILDEIETFKNKRPQYCAEYLYEKYLKEL